MKKNSDILIRGLIKELNIRFSFIETTETVTKAILLHDTDPVSSFLYGRALTTAGLISPLLNGEEKYSLSWAYNGLLSSIITDVNAKCHLRGITKTPHLIEQISDEEDIFGTDGEISLIKSENGKILNSGMIDAGLLDISDDIALFFCISDQIETEIITQIKFTPDIKSPVAISAGFMLQAMPDCDLMQFETFRNKIKTIDFAELLTTKEPLLNELTRPDGRSINPTCGDKKAEILLEHIFSDKVNDYKHLKEELNISYKIEESPTYKCSCSYEKMKMTLNVLEKDDLKQLLKEQKSIKIKCEYCTKSYEFTELA